MVKSSSELTLILIIAHRWKIFQIQPKKNVTKHGTSMKNNLKAFMLMTGKKYERNDS